VVRGPAALLTALAGAALLWLAPVLPALDGDAATLVAGTVGLVAVVAIATLPVPAIAARPVLWPALLAAVLLTVALAVAGAGPAATPAEALAYGVAGTAFAAVLDAPALALALPLFVAAVDVASVAGGSSGSLQLDLFATGADPLALALPAWGTDGTVAELSGADVLLLAAFAAYARRFALRPRATIAALAVALVTALVALVVLDRAMPVLALLAGAFYAANLGRLQLLSGGARAG